ncbi:hypothetical protein J2X52_000835 [Luteimonas sp. 3794]|nr:hypothetical protein [Luteimonas sp. 3794]
MGSFSIWHWVIVLGVIAIPVAVVCLIVWALRRGRTR